jgi:hypothetical protein
MDDMKITVEVVAAGECPPEGSPVIVQVRDAGYADAVATTLGETTVRSRVAKSGQPIGHASIRLESQGSYPIVWVHVDVDNSGDVSIGDYVTMESYPIRGVDSIRVEVRRVT